MSLLWFACNKLCVFEKRWIKSTNVRTATVHRESPLVGRWIFKSVCNCTTRLHPTLTYYINILYYIVCTYELLKHDDMRVCGVSTVWARSKNEVFELALWSVDIERRLRVLVFLCWVAAIHADASRGGRNRGRRCGVYVYIRMKSPASICIECICTRACISQSVCRCWKFDSYVQWTHSLNFCAKGWFDSTNKYMCMCFKPNF